jgi:hypothetical protein
MIENQIIDTTTIIEHAKNIVTQSAIKQNDTNTLLQYDFLRITDKTAIPYPIPIIKISGEIISTPEAITAISGQPKSGKSAFMSILIAGSIAPDGIDGLDQVEVLPNNEGKAVIHFETEQAPWKQQSNQRTILNRASLTSCPDFFLSYNVRKLEIEALQPTVTGICQAASDQFKGIHSIYIDGIADFIKDPNNPEASFDIVKYLESIAQTYFCPIIVVVHTNPGSEKERGHLGSQVQRKAEGVLSVKKEGNISYLDPKLLRHAGDDIPKIQFRYDYEKKYHVQCELENPKDRKAIEKVTKLKELSEQIFSGQRSYKWGEAIDAVMKLTALGRNTAINLFKEMKAHDLIMQSEDTLWKESNKTGLQV